MSGAQIVGAVSISSLAIPLVAGIAAYRRLSPALKVLLVLIFIISLVEGYTLYQVLNHGQYEWIHYIYMPFEYGLFASVLFKWQTDARLKKILLWSIPAFTLVCIVNALATRDFSRTNNFVVSVACGLYIVMTTYTFVVIQKNTLGEVLKNPRFWISSALLLYAAGSLTYFAFLKLLPINQLMIAWYFHSALGIATNLLYAGGFICQYRR